MNILQLQDIKNRQDVFTYHARSKRSVFFTNFEAPSQGGIR